MKEIALTNGDVVLVDDGDFSLVSQYRWSKGSHGYAMACRSKDHDIGMVLMHRFILGLQKGCGCTDHINRNKLDNRRINLRVGTNQQNSMNRIGRVGKKLKGVRFNKHAKKYEAYICMNYGKTHLGLFATEELAARAYDNAAVSMFGEFALRNIPEIQ